MAQPFVSCDICELRPAKHFCNTCSGNACQICKVEHKQKKIFKHHEIIPLIAEKKSTNSLCSDHRTVCCLFYCNPCEKPVCSKCLTEKHKGHNVEEYSTFLDGQKESLIQFIERIETFLIPVHQILLKEMQTNRAVVIQSVEEVSSSVEVQIKNIICAIKSAEFDILSALEKNKKEALKSIESDQNVLSDRIYCLHEIKNTLLDLNKSHLVDDTLLKQQISNTEEFEIFPEMTTVTPLKFIPGELDTSVIQNRIGTLSTFGLSKRRNPLTFEPSFHQTLVNSDKKLLKKPVRTVKLKVDVHKQYEIRCMGTQTAVVRGNDNKVRVVDISGKVTTITTILPLDIWPRGITLTNENEIFYNDKYNRKVMRASINGDISTFLTLRTDYFPSALSVTHSGNILICFVLKADPDDKDQQGIVIEYTTSEQIVNEFITYDGKQLFIAPEYIAENPINHDILVSDYGSKKVIVLNNLGNLKFEYHGKALSKSDKFWPKQITCDSLCHILIADSYSSAIHVVGQDGDPLRLMLNGKLNKPAGVCFDGVDSIWIAEYESKTIKIFKYLD